MTCKLTAVPDGQGGGRSIFVVVGSDARHPYTDVAVFVREADCVFNCFCRPQVATMPAGLAVLKNAGCNPLCPRPLKGVHQRIVPREVLEPVADVFEAEPCLAGCRSTLLPRS